MPELMALAFCFEKSFMLCSGDVKESMPKHTQIYVFTDLDGTFLDHANYDYAPAMSALARLQSINAHVIPVTSKTIAELHSLNLPLGETQKIAENGMVIFDGECEISVGQSYNDIIAFINTLPSDIRQHLQGFHGMSVDDVVLHTSLSREQAKLAKTRLGSEPFLWSGAETALNDLLLLAEESGLFVTRGGRFYHLMGAQGGKAEAIRRLLVDCNDAITIALGDGPNDAEMLGSVDYGIKIPNAQGHDFRIKNPRGEIIDAPKQGPEGWSMAIHGLLDRLRF